MEYGLAVLGGGRIVGAHAGVAAAVPGLKLVGIAEANPERHADLIERFHCEVFTDIAELLKRDEVHCAAICLPHHLHLPIALQAIDAGKHLLIEKPMALNVAECDQILDAAVAAGVKVAVGHHHSYTSLIREARRLIESEQAGRLVMGAEVWTKAFHLGERPPWFLDRKCGGGMWWMNAPHQVDRLLRLVGSPVVAVKAKVSNEIFNYSAADSGLAILEFENGVYASITHVGHRFGEDLFESTLTCSHGAVRLRDQTLSICGEDGFQSVDVAPNSPHQEMWKNFISAIDNDEESYTSGWYGREVVSICEAAERSGELGREVRIEELARA